MVLVSNFSNIIEAYSDADCQDYLSKSLFVVGELGGNDYNAALFAGWSPDKTSTYTPQVVQYIYNGVEVRKC